MTIIRGSLHTIVYAVVIVAIVIYLAVHFNLTGLVVKESLTNLLSEQINSRITLDGDAEVNWLNQVVLNDVTIYDQQDDTLLHARRAMVAFDLLPAENGASVTLELVSIEPDETDALQSFIALLPYPLHLLSERVPATQGRQ